MDILHFREVVPGSPHPEDARNLRTSENMTTRLQDTGHFPTHG